MALRNSSPEFQKQATLVNNNIAALEAYNESVMDSAHPLSALASNLVGVGKAFVSMSIQFGIVWLLSKGIAALVNNIDSSINAMKYAKEAAENLNKAYEDMNTTQKQNTKTVEEYGKTWEKLKGGVDENTGKNISLSDDEYNQYKESINQIISILPGIASGWDDNNNAILLNVQSMDELNQKMEEYAQKQRESLLAGDETKGLQEKAGKIDLAGATRTLTYAESLITAIKSNDVAGVKQAIKDAVEREKDTGVDYIGDLLDYHGFTDLDNYGISIDREAPSIYSENSYVTDATERLLDGLENYITSNSEAVESLTQGWENIASAWTAIQFSSAPSIKKAYSDDQDFNNRISEEVQTAMQNFIAKQGGEFYGQFKTTENLYAYLKAMFDDVAKYGNDEATKAYQKAAEQSYGDYAKARQSYVNSWNGLATEDRSFYDLRVPYLRDYFGGGMDEYSAMRQRAQEWNFTQEQVDSLTSEQLNYIKSLGADTEKVFTSFAAFLADFAKYQTQIETSYDGLKTKWDKATEAQTTAQEVMTATDANGGVLTQENYNKLIGENKAYGAAVTTIGGVTTIDSDRLNASNL